MIENAKLGRLCPSVSGALHDLNQFMSAPTGHIVPAVRVAEPISPRPYQVLEKLNSHQGFENGAEPILRTSSPDGFSVEKEMRKWQTRIR
ncbi:MAG TPA: hypothetical protein PLR02_13835 [Rhodocyclaceae bacterium]|nr:hypothetical protein [Rhodocyclaceae bacterium]